MKKCYEIDITGRVQGVGYRAFVQKQANQLKVKGWVRNMSDGGVKILVQIDSNALTTFASRLRIGSIYSTVVDLNLKEVDCTGSYERFDILF